MNTCTFCGHHDAPDSLRPILVAAVEKLITENEADNFYVGTHGNFDRMALSVLREMKKTILKSITLSHLRIFLRKKRNIQSMPIMKLYCRME